MAILDLLGLLVVLLVLGILTAAAAVLDVRRGPPYALGPVSEAMRRWLGRPAPGQASLATLDQQIAQMRRDLRSVQEQIGVVQGAAGEIEARWHGQEALASSVDAEVEVALRAGQDEHARVLLLRRNTSRELASALKAQYEQHVAQIDALVAAVNALETRVFQAQAERDLLFARQTRAAVEERVHLALSTAGEQAAPESLRALEDTVNQREEQVKALIEMGRDPLDERFARLEGSAAPGIDEEIAARKKALQNRDG